ncbi:serine/threonine-protein kinase [Nannocystis punicea]|uniref:non-specific serine/threonine protein kinase n=1 Tax=Nannocystis punicea TaxID=2995304 RepID=A0ABY7H9I5_9BACT|nr:serine/threonine-protein kinase [Nannocystis poenicansa]WAS95755.1 protein kinase [Nannocystis poenicansa]
MVDERALQDDAPTDGSQVTLVPGSDSIVTVNRGRARGLEDVPSRIGRYVILGRLGAGGMGVVYAAYDPELDRKVAIKLMYAEESEAGARRSQALLLREARALAKLSHPNIVAIHDVGVHAGQVFVAMEFVAGRTLRRWLEEAPRGWQTIVEVFVQAGRGLMAAHAVGLVHRDVKPDNLLVGDDGRVRVADFGVARHREPDEAARIEGGASRTMATVVGRGARIGTPAYMAPEQHGNEGVGPHSDQFSFCVALHEALHGLRPFAGETPDDLVAAIRAGELRRPSEPSRLPGWLDRAMQRGLAARPADRWPSLSALLSALTPEQGQARARRGWRALYAALLVVGGAALVFAAREWQLGRAREQAEQAAAERLQVVIGGVDRLLARGRRGEAEEALRAFVAEPEHRASRAALDAWLLWADRMDEARDHEAGLAALVEAYTGLPAKDPREAAIFLRIARLFGLQWRFAELATLARTAGQRSPQAVHTPTWSGLRADAALGLRDVSGFLAEVDGGLAGREREDVAPVLRALNAASFPEVRGEHVVVVDLEGDGRRELAVFPRDGQRGPVSLRRMDRALSPVLELTGDDAIGRVGAELGALHRSADGSSHLLGRVDGDAVLYALGPGPPHIVHTWPYDQLQAAAAADLDGDGLREFYVGTGPYTRRLYRLTPDASGTWQRSPAHPPTDELGSDINALATGDFDGDGRDELAVAVGPWRAYDVRVLQAGPDGALELGARRRIGHVRALTSLRGVDGGTLLAIAKDNEAASKGAFSPDTPHGEPPGLYVVRRDGEALTTVFFAPFPAPDGAQEVGRVRTMERGDFDGDGRDDLILRYRAPSRSAMATLLWRQREDGSFVSASLEHVVPHAVGNFDDDPADELLVTTPRGDGEALAILGAGGEPLASVLPPRVNVTPPTVSDPSLARAWARAEDLVGFGLYAAAAEALARRSALVQSHEDGRAAQQRAAALYEAAGDHARAAASHAVLAQDGDVGAALAAIASYERALDLASALRVARAVLASDAPTPSQRDEARAAGERLAAAVEPRDVLELRFDQPLAQSWQLHEPLAVRVDRGRGSLAIDAFADTGDLMTLPIELTGGPLGLEVEVDVERAEWAAQLAVAVRTPGGEEVMSLGVAAGGGGGYLRRHGSFTAPSLPRRLDIAGRPTDDPSAPSRHLLQARLLPHQGMIDVEERGEHAERRTFPLRQALRPGPHLLVLRASGVEEHGAQQLRARLRRVSLVGARLSAAAAPAEPGQELARALVTGQWRAAAASPADGELAPLWRATAAAELGRLDDALALLATLDLERPVIRKHLRHLLRGQPTRFVPLMRGAFGPRHAELLREALAEAARMHLDAELQQVWLSQTLDVESLPTADAAQLDTKVELLTLRAAAWQAAGDLEQAAADLDAAAALRQSDGEARSERLAELDVLIAEVAAARARPEEALAAVARALARTRAPASMKERLRIDPRLRGLQDDPRWRRLLDARP